MKTFFVYSPHHSQLLREENCRLICTFARVRRQDDGIYEMADGSTTQKFVPYLPEGYSEIIIDSGGFQLQRGDVQVTMPISVKTYASWLNSAIKKYPEIVGYMNLDLVQLPGYTQYIKCKQCKNEEKAPLWQKKFLKEITKTKKCKLCGGRLKLVRKSHPETLEEKTKRMELSAIISLENQFILEGEGLSPIPVWHDGEPEEYLRYYCDRYQWVAIGGLVGRLKSKDYYRKLVNRITQNYPNTDFHLLGIGITGIEAFRQGKIFSTDFSTWSTVSRYGHVIVTDPKQLIKEVKMSDEDRDRLRHDQEFQLEVTRQSIKNIQMFEKSVNDMKITEYQNIMRLPV